MSPSPRASANSLCTPGAGLAGSAATAAPVSLGPSPALADAAALGDADVGAQDVREAGTNLEPQADARSPPSSPAPCPSPPGAAATPDTPAIPEGLGDEYAFVDEFEFERRQHDLEVETWSCRRKEQEDALNCRQAQLDAYAGNGGRLMLKWPALKMYLCLYA